MKSVQVINASHPHAGEVGWLLDPGTDGLLPERRENDPSVRVVVTQDGQRFCVYPGDCAALPVALNGEPQ